MTNSHARSCRCAHVAIVTNIHHVTSRQEYIIKEKRVSNLPIRSVGCVQKVTRLECKFINDLFRIRDSIRTEFRVYKHNQSRIRRLYAFQARDFLHAFNATYRSVRYSLLVYYIYS